MGKLRHAVDGMTYLGPLNHFRALTTHQMRMNIIGPPYTRHVQFMPVALFPISDINDAWDSSHILEITSRHTWQHQDRQHQQHECTCHCSNRPAGSSEIPRSRSEPVSRQKHSDEDRDGEGNKRRYRSDGEQSPRREFSAQDQYGHGDANRSVEPHRVDRRPCVAVHSFSNARQWPEAVVTRVCECDSGSSDLIYPLAWSPFHVDHCVIPCTLDPWKRRT